MSHIRRIGVTCFLSMLAQFAYADISREIAEASAPIAEGVPEVAVVRLQAFFNKTLPASEGGGVAGKLCEGGKGGKEAEKNIAFVAGLPRGGKPLAKNLR